MSYEQCDPNVSDMESTDCATLRPGQELRTKAVVGILAMFKHESKFNQRVWIQSPDLMVSMRRRGDKTWQRWCDRHDLDLDVTEVVIFPFCIARHWSFFRVFVRDRRIDYVTSSGGEPRGSRQLVIKYMARKSWSVAVSSSRPPRTKAPKQDNGVDCGMFLLAGIECCIHDQSLDYDPTSIMIYRRRLEERYTLFLNQIVLSYPNYYYY
jgi:Ulp1 family protease